MKPEDIASYLKEHPEFFEDYADALAQIYLPHPHGGRTISISERQILTLREKCRQLEAKLHEVIQFGEENDAIGEKIHRFAAALLGTRDVAGVLSVAYLYLREDFAVPHVVLRVWHPAAPGGAPESGAVSGATREFAASLTQPYCCAHAMVDTIALFGDAGPHLRSFSYVPLRASETFGLVALASEDPQRFYADMGTLFLKRLGDLISAALLRHLGA
jgi:uncharacterized protein YigA (DUF484 family)